MNPIFRTLLRMALIGCLLTTASGVSADDNAPRFFEIELLVFENLTNSDNGEVWPIDYSDWFDETVTTDTQPLYEKDIVWLPQSARRLAAERNALGRSSQYRPLAYYAWRQAVDERAEARPVELPAEPSATGRYVDGTARVAVERYLHLYLDLQLHSRRDAAVEDGDYQAAEIRLREHRRMRSREVHFFDNPRFGVIALITPFEAESSPPP